MRRTPSSISRRPRPTAGHLLALAAGALLVTLSFGQTPASGEPVDEAAQRWGVPPLFDRETAEPIHPQWAKRLTGYLNTRDGIPLRYSVLLPVGPGPFPVIINYSGYDPGAIGGYSYLHNNTAMSNDLDASLLQAGYAIVGVNARGTGCSEGDFDFLAPSYGTDGADAVEWAAKQPWSSGSIGMANWSWAGMSQIATASERPAHLRAIAPGMALTDPRLDSWEIGGVPSQGFVTGWWMFLHSRWLAVRRSASEEHDARCLAQVESNYRSGQSSSKNLPSQLVRHPLRDDWIEQRTILNRAERIEVPVLSMEAFQDEATTARAGYYQERLNPDRLWYLQTNGNHDLYESLKFRPILLAFFDHFLKGLDNRFDKRPHVEIWQETYSASKEPGNPHDEQAQPGWVIQRARFPVAVDPLELKLAGGNRLLLPGEHPQSTSTTAPDAYQYPIEGPTVDTDAYNAVWGVSVSRWREGSLAYTSAPLKNDLVIYGPASADLWISSTLSDTDVQVTLTEVRADGQERFVQRGWLRMSDRALNAARSTATRPWPCDTPACIQALSPDVAALGRVELTKVSYAFRIGSRIRIWIDAPSATGLNSFDHSSLTSTNEVWHDTAHVSKLVLGQLGDVKVSAPAASCDAVLMQPCRPDPIAPH